jgi:hypothetical protein
MQTLLRKTDFLFPEQTILVNRLTLLQGVGAFLILTIVFSIAGLFMPPGGFIAFDWVHFFGPRLVPDYYPPWTILVVNLLSWPLLVGLNFATLSLAAYQRSRHVVSLICVFFSLPVMWTIFLGQIDGLVLLGTVGLPWLAPLALLKPQVSIWAFGARRSYLLGFAVVVLISFAIWGFWPSAMFDIWEAHAGVKYDNDISIGLWGLPVALVLLWLSRGDIDMLMLGGLFMTPYLLPYSLIVVAPAVARLPPRMAVIAFILSWTPFSANWLGPGGWWLGWLFIVWVWMGLAMIRYPDTRMSLLMKQIGLLTLPEKTAAAVN